MWGLRLERGDVAIAASDITLISGEQELSQPFSSVVPLSATSAKISFCVHLQCSRDSYSAGILFYFGWLLNPIIAESDGL